MDNGTVVSVLFIDAKHLIGWLAAQTVNPLTSPCGVNATLWFTSIAPVKHRTNARGTLPFVNAPLSDTCSTTTVLPTGTGRSSVIANVLAPKNVLWEL